jgi:RNA polymerase sigma factor (sigma-70 family)
MPENHLGPDIHLGENSKIQHSTDAQTLAGFRAGEAEVIVTQIRTHLRAGKTREAEQLFTTLMHRLKTRIEQVMKKQLNRRADLLEDGIMEATLMIWERISDLREISSIQHWERRFHQSLKLRLIDALDKTLADYDDKHPTSALIEEADSETPEGERNSIHGAITASVEEDVVGKILIEQLPGEQRDAFRLFLDGYTTAESAERLGCSVKTVYNRIEAAKRTLQQHFKAAL